MTVLSYFLPVDFGELCEGSQYLQFPFMEGKKASQGGTVCSWRELTSLDFLHTSLKFCPSDHSEACETSLSCS